MSIPRLAGLVAILVLATLATVWWYLQVPEVAPVAAANQPEAVEGTPEPTLTWDSLPRGTFRTTGQRDEPRKGVRRGTRTVRIEGPSGSPSALEPQAFEIRVQPVPAPEVVPTAVGVEEY